MATPKKRAIGNVMGFAPSSLLWTFQPQELNGATTWIGYSFVPDYNISLNEVRVFCTAIQGTLAAANLTCYLYSDGGSGTPSSTILAQTSTLRSPIAAGAWAEFIGFNYALTAGSIYWIVIKNSNGTPASNNATFVYGGYQSMPSMCGGLDNVWKAQTYAGSWNSFVGSCPFCRVKYSDGNVDGFPMSALVTSTTVNKGEAGAKLVLPGDASIVYNLIGIALGFDGPSVTGNCVLSLYVGASSTTPAATITLPGTTPNAYALNGLVPFYFATPQAIPGGSTIRIVASDAVNEATGPRVYCAAWDTDSASAILLPFSGNLMLTARPAGGSWTDTPLTIPYCTLLLADAVPVSANASALPASPSSLIFA